MQTNYYTRKANDLFSFIGRVMELKESTKFTNDLGRQLAREFNLEYLAIDVPYGLYSFPDYDSAINRAVEYSQMLIKLSNERPNIADIELIEENEHRSYIYTVDNCMTREQAINQLEAYFINTKEINANADYDCSGEWLTRGALLDNVQHNFDNQFTVKINYHLDV